MNRFLISIAIIVLAGVLLIGFTVGFGAIQDQPSQKEKKETNATGSSSIEESSDKPGDYPPVMIRGTELRKLKSKYVDQEYEIDVALPLHYEESEIRCPVIYVNDAEYNFGCVSYIARRLMKQGDLPPVIVVGIAYDTGYEDFYDRRARDLTPTKGGGPSGKYGSGGAEAFSTFLEKELIPFIDVEYRTVPGDRTIVGHSYGGLYGLYALFKHTELFSRYLVVSPSIWYDRRVINTYEKEYAASHKDMTARVYLSAGSEEARISVDTPIMGKTLTGRKYPSLKLNTVIEQGEHHRSIVAIAYTRGLRYLFQPESESAQ